MIYVRWDAWWCHTCMSFMYIYYSQTSVRFLMVVFIWNNIAYSKMFMLYLHPITNTIGCNQIRHTTHNWNWNRLCSFKTGSQCIHPIKMGEFGKAMKCQNARIIQNNSNAWSKQMALRVYMHFCPNINGRGTKVIQGFVQLLRIRIHILFSLNFFSIAWYVCMRLEQMVSWTLLVYFYNDHMQYDRRHVSKLQRHPHASFVGGSYSRAHVCPFSSCMQAYMIIHYAGVIWRVMCCRKGLPYIL